MEQEGREIEVAGAGISRGQNAMYVLPHDWAAIAPVLTPLLERVEHGLHDVQLLVLTPDAEAATAVSMTAVELLRGRDVRVVAATSGRRASRVMRARPPQVLVGAPDTIVELLRGAAVKLDSVRTICIAWIDEIVTRGGAGALENLMAELPKDSARTVVTAEVTPAVEELLERYARRARRELASVTETDAPVPVDYVTTSAQSRLATLRRVLDETDPKSALVFVRDTAAVGQARGLLAALGYDADESTIRTGLTAAAGTDLVVLFDLPSSREELRAATGDAKRTIAIVQPRQLASLRALAAGGPLKPVTMPESGSRARDRDAKVRAELGAVLGAGQFGRELLAIEPLLEAYDGAEIAAAALQLLERERAARVAPETAGAFGSPVQTRPQNAVEMTRLFVNVGSRDGLRPADIVGAIANQGGAAVGEIGKVDVRESHSTVEVAAIVADAVIEKVTGMTIRGRRAVARRDEQPAARSGAPRERSGPPGRGGGGRSSESGGRGARPTGPPRHRDSSARPAGGRPSTERPRRGGERNAEDAGGGGRDRG